MFPIGFPDFTDDQRRRLRTLGVIDEQVNELRHALIVVRQYVRTPAANNVQAEHLAEIESLARELSRKLRTAVVPEAARMIEERYWLQRVMDDGATVAGHLCPRLDVLAASAASAADSLPKGKPVRSRAGNPEPVKRIDEALHAGWAKAHSLSLVSTWIDPDHEETELTATLERIASQLPESGSDASKALAKAQRYPDSFYPSVSTGRQGQGRAFPDIVEICYAAAGYQQAPKRALEAYVKAHNRNRKELLAGLDAALSAQE